MGTKMTTLVAKAKPVEGLAAEGQAADELSRLDLAEPLDYVERNRAAWERWAPAHAAAARAAWQGQLEWGVWGTPESEVRLLHGVEPQITAIELGCGTAGVSSWLTRLGLRPIGVDIVRAQLETAARLQEEFGITFGLLCANAERLHFADSSFGLAISDYGASLWCDPQRWLPEARRLLRPSGLLIMVNSSPSLMACTPSNGGHVQDRLVRDHFGPHRYEFLGNGAVEFHLTHGEWISALSEHGFVVESLLEIQPPPDARARVEFAPLSWARRWPSEDIWVARKIA